MGVNETKTKCMSLEHNGNVNLKFNGKYIEKVKNYKYLGNIFRSVSWVSEDIFCVTYPYLGGQSYVYINVTVHAILYYVLSYRYFSLYFCTT